MDRPMRLSEAIKLGSMLRPQGFGSPFSGEQGRREQACALEAAGLAISEQYIQLRDHFDALNSPCACPECGTVLDLCCVISTHLNDAHHWSRERIADYVATIEDKLAARQQPAEHAEVSV